MKAHIRVDRKNKLIHLAATSAGDVQDSHFLQERLRADQTAGDADSTKSSA